MRSLQELKAELAAVEAWMESSAYDAWLTGQYMAVEQLKASIVDIAENWDEVVGLRGELRSVTVNILSFEDIRKSLNEEIDRVENTENNPTTTNVENEHERDEHDARVDDTTEQQDLL